MERNKKVKFKKIGGGSLRFQGKIIKPNQEFWADPIDIPETFRDIVIPVDPLGLEKKKETVEEVKEGESSVVYSLKHRGGGWFDVINSETGKVINEKALPKGEAEKLIESLK